MLLPEQRSSLLLSGEPWEQEAACYGVNCAPPNSQAAAPIPPVSHKVAVFGNGVIADVLSSDEGTLE